MNLKNLGVFYLILSLSLGIGLAFCGDGNIESNETCVNCPQDYWNSSVDIMVNSTQPYKYEAENISFYYNTQNCTSDFSTFNCSMFVSNSTNIIYGAILTNCSFSSNGSLILYNQVSYTPESYDAIMYSFTVSNYNITHSYFYQSPVNCTENWSNTTDWILGCLNESLITYNQTFEDSHKCDETNYTYVIYYPNGTCDYSSCGDLYCNQNIYTCNLGSCVLSAHESQQNCCNDCGVPNELYLCTNNQLVELKTTKSLKDIGSGVGGFFSVIAGNIVLIMIVLAIITMVGLIIYSLGKNEKLEGIGSYE